MRAPLEPLQAEYDGPPARHCDPSRRRRKPVLQSSRRKSPPTAPSEHDIPRAFEATSANIYLESDQFQTQLAAEGCGRALKSVQRDARVGRIK
jgi:hypothetical protein